MSHPAPSILRSTVANWAAFAVAAVVSFLLSPFIVHRLGNSAYGTWVLLGSFVGYLGLLDLGVRGAVTRFVANQYAAGDHAAASTTVLGISTIRFLRVSLTSMNSVFIQRYRVSGKWTDPRISRNGEVK